jgi:hypothetical protein
MSGSKASLHRIPSCRRNGALSADGPEVTCGREHPVSCYVSRSKRGWVSWRLLSPDGKGIPRVKVKGSPQSWKDEAERSNAHRDLPLGWLAEFV